MKPSPFMPSSFPMLPPLRGVTIATAAAGIRYQNRDDMLLIVFGEKAQVAGVYTRSLTAAAPVQWCRAACEGGAIRALVVNSGNANAFTGSQGMRDAEAVAHAVAKQLNIEPSQVMMSSTGVIGEFLPVPRMVDAIPTLKVNLHADGWEKAARAIMTTDTFPKMVTRTATIDGVTVTVHGISKGSGMIAPDMATMLGYIVTDAALPATILQPLLSRGTAKTFNAITVDSDTSTNDTVLLIATGEAGNSVPTSAGDAALDGFKLALREVMQELATLIVKDGEGASKFVTIYVRGAEDDEAARVIGMSIANSPLVKTAIAAEDPNWGRVVAAVGKAGKWIDTEKLRLWFGDVQITEGGMVCRDYSEVKAKAVMQQAEFTIAVDVGVGIGEATVWTCDLTEEYIKINANYRS
jgi:glutamate N-acetyltransferase / amino-acid N-acetyltransferase